MHQFRRLLKIILPLALLTLTALAANIAAKWSGILEIDQGGSGEKIERPVELQLELKGGALSGKIGLSGDPEGVEIRNGKVEGDTITFEASSPEASAAMRFTLTIHGDQLQGEMKGIASGNELFAKVSLYRLPQ